MIFVDALAPRGAPWRGGISCHMISDVSREELIDFAIGMRLDQRWFQPLSYPHFDLAPRQRKLAIALGARAVGRADFVAALRRGREAEREADRASRAAYRAWIDAGPGRGPYPGGGR